MDGGLPDGMFLRMTPDELPKTPRMTKNSDGSSSILFQQKERLGDSGLCSRAPPDISRPSPSRCFADACSTTATLRERPHVAVISDSLARTRWPGQDPIGHTIEFGNMDGDMRLLTIVGIVG